jgi:hypothetical protein
MVAAWTPHPLQIQELVTPAAQGLEPDFPQYPDERQALRQPGRPARLPAGPA